MADYRKQQYRDQIVQELAKNPFGQPNYIDSGSEMMGRAADQVRAADEGLPDIGSYHNVDDWKKQRGQANFNQYANGILGHAQQGIGTVAAGMGMAANNPLVAAGGGYFINEGGKSIDKANEELRRRSYYNMLLRSQNEDQ